jgi:hypothetical protein
VQANSAAVLGGVSEGGRDSPTRGGGGTSALPPGGEGEDAISLPRSAGGFVAVPHVVQRVS